MKLRGLFSQASLSLLLPLMAVSSYGANRAIVYGTTCQAYEQSRDSDLAFISKATISTAEALKSAGWDVVPLYGGNSVWCDPSSDKSCIPSKVGRLNQVLAGSSFQASQLKPATSVNLLQALSDAASALKKGDQLLISVNTHGDENEFCASDGAVLTAIGNPFATAIFLLYHKGIKVALDANYCFSGSAVQSLSDYACVVSVASGTTMSLFGDPTIADVLASSGSSANMEDLFTSRLASKNGILNFREPEISGFTPGNQFNDQFSKALFSGDAYSFGSDSFFVQYFDPAVPEGQAPCANCTDAQASAFYSKFQQALSGWENSAGENQCKDLQKEMANTALASGGIDLSELTSGTYYTDLQKELQAYIAQKGQYNTLAHSGQADLAALQQIHFAPYSLDVNSIAASGTANGLQTAFENAMKDYASLLPDSTGKLNNPKGFSQVFMNTDALKQIAQGISSSYAQDVVTVTEVQAEAQTDKKCPKMGWQLRE